jgi:nicotinamidase-related amidase
MGKTVLLVMDIQNGVLELLGNMEPYLNRLAPVINSTREAGIPIIYVATGFRPGYPEASARNSSTAKVAAWGAFIEGDESTKIHPAVAPADGDVVITKRRVSAFHGTDLDLILRSMDAETLVITGLISSGVVLSTVRQGADLDYRLTVLKDLSMDREQETHEMLINKVFAKQAQILSSAEWVAGLKKL